MISYLTVAVIAVALVAVLAVWLVWRARNQSRIPSLNSLRDASRRGVQRTSIRARTDRSSQDALQGMISDLSVR